MSPSKSPLIQAALLTPLGSAGITVLQVVGCGAVDLLATVLRDGNGQPIDLPPNTGKIHHGYIVEPDGQRVDEVILCVSKLTRQGTQAVDICCHGGVRPAQKIMEVLTAAGASPVQANDLPGAGLAQFVDLAGGTYHGVAGEVLNALCRATTNLTVRILLEQLQGGLTAQLRRLLSEELSPQQLRHPIERLLASWNWGRRLVTPPTLAIIGPVNAGKSSLANLLSSRPASIVTSRPGTTRDWVTHQTSLDGLSVVLIDTAGHRDTLDPLEAQAIHRAAQQSRLADLQLIVIDGSKRTQTLPQLSDHIPTVVALNKADLKGFSAKALPPELAHWPCVQTSIVTSQGRQELTAALLKALNCQKLRDGGAVVFTQRQKECLDRADQALRAEAAPDLQAAQKALAQCLGTSQSLPNA